MWVCKDALQAHLCPDASKKELICVPIHIACDSTITDTQGYKNNKNLITSSCVINISSLAQTHIALLLLRGSRLRKSLDVWAGQPGETDKYVR